MITLDYDSSIGQVSFRSDSISDDLRIIHRIKVIVDSKNRPFDFRDDSIGDFTISMPLFLENHDLILRLLADNERSLILGPAFEEFLDWAYELLTSNDMCEELDKEEIDQRLSDAGWNFEIRRPSDFQYRNLREISGLGNVANFSVPGAGKTVEALAYACLKVGRPRGILVVSPRNAYIAWETEALHCLGLTSEEVYRAVGTNEDLEERLLSNDPPRIVLVNYNRLWSRVGLFSQYLRHLSDIGIASVAIFDESHHFKGGKAFTSAVKQISPLAAHRVLLSGTPMPRDVDDLVPQFQALLPMLIQEINESTVRNFTEGRFVRTTKDDLGLRETIVKFIRLPMATIQREVYQILTDFVAAEIASVGSRRAHAELSRMQRVIMFLVMQASNPRLLDSRIIGVIGNSNPELAERIQKANDSPDFPAMRNGPKVAYVCQRARELAREGRKVVIWSTFVDNILWIAEELEDLNAVFIRGDVPTLVGNETFARDDESDSREEYREERIRRFIEDPDCSVLVANPQTAGEGISLHTVCHHAIYVDRSFNATEFMQSVDRIHRYGLDEENKVICANLDTTIEIIECEDCVDQGVQTNLARKQEAMYTWLNDPSLNPALALLMPPFTEIELENLIPSAVG